MNGWVANNQSASRRAILSPKGGQEPVNLGECLSKADFNELAMSFDQWLAQSVGIMLQSLESGAFWTEEASTVHIITVATDQLHVSVNDMDLKSAPRLTKRTHMSHNLWLADAVAAHGAALVRK